MKKADFKLTSLTVKSFVTELPQGATETVKGGFLSIGRECTQLNNCPMADRHTNGIFCAD
ncbi:MAG: pinensin family lanthipeptide [Cyclobacteriaceae bacterium]